MHLTILSVSVGNILGVIKLKHQRHGKFVSLQVISLHPEKWNIIIQVLTTSEQKYFVSSLKISGILFEVNSCDSEPKTLFSD